MENIETKIKKCTAVQELEMLSQKYCKEIFYDPRLESLIKRKLIELSEKKNRKSIQQFINKIRNPYK
jgi:hypothetical protein